MGCLCLRVPAKLGFGYLFSHILVGTALPNTIYGNQLMKSLQIYGSKRDDLR